MKEGFGDMFGVEDYLNLFLDKDLVVDSVFQSLVEIVDVLIEVGFVSFYFHSV